MPKILVVEDNEENRDALARRLVRRGYAVITANDGHAGLAMANAERPDLILMDMNMPELDGWEATRQIKANQELRDVPVLALTAYALTGDKERAVAAGCVDYHTKPIDFPKLLNQIEELLQTQAETPESQVGESPHEN
jgi:two-component system, cell cycle response regulator DivK